MTPLGQCEVTCEGPACVARISGEVDTSNAAGFENYILDRVPNESVCLVIDLSAVRFLDSSGVRLLFALDERCRARRQRCSIAIPPDHLVRRILQMVRVEAIIPVCESVEAAIAATREAM